MKFRLLNPDAIPWDRLDQFPDRTVFQTRPWVSFVAESQGAQPVVAELTDGGDVAGYFTGLTFRRFGIKILGSSFPGWTTPYMGFNLKNGALRSEALAALESFAFGDLGCLHMEVSDPGFRPEDGSGLGFGLRYYETYETDLTQSEDQIFGGMNSACRRCIRKAEKVGVRVEHATDPDSFAREYYDQLNDVFAKQGLVPTYDLERVRTLVKHLLPSGNVLLVRAIAPEGDCIGTGIYPGFNRTAEFWGNASWRSKQILRPNETLHWYAMRYWKNRGATRFDWGGGGTYKEKYGPRLIAVPWFSKSRYKVLVRLRALAQGAFAFRQRLLGRMRAPEAGGQEQESAD